MFLERDLITELLYHQKLSTDEWFRSLEEALIPQDSYKPPADLMEVLNIGDYPPLNYSPVNWVWMIKY